MDKIAEKLGISGAEVDEEPYMDDDDDALYTDDEEEDDELLYMSMTIIQLTKPLT